MKFVEDFLGCPTIEKIQLTIQELTKIDAASAMTFVGFNAADSSNELSSV